MTDRYMKVMFTIIALALIWLGVKDTRLEPVVSAQNQGWDDTALALGLPNANLALPTGSGYAHVCVKIVCRGCVGPLRRLWGPFREFQERTQLWGQFYRLRFGLL